MQRTFANSVSNFVISGGMVSFMLDDRVVDGEGKPVQNLKRETVAHIIMREAEFAQMLNFFGDQMRQHLGEQGQSPGAPMAPAAGQPMGGAHQGGQPQPPLQAPFANSGGPKGQKPSGGFQIKPKT